MAQSDGAYKVCFGNQMSTVTAKIVVMDMLVRSAKGQPAEEKKDTAGDPALESLRESLSLLSETANEMNVELRYLKNREVAHTNSMPTALHSSHSFSDCQYCSTSLQLGHV